MSYGGTGTPHTSRSSPRGDETDLSRGPDDRNDLWRRAEGEDYLLSPETQADMGSSATSPRRVAVQTTPVRGTRPHKRACPDATSGPAGQALASPAPPTGPVRGDRSPGPDRWTGRYGEDPS